MAEFFEEIIVPVIEVPEVKRGKNVKTEKKGTETGVNAVVLISVPKLIALID